MSPVLMGKDGYDHFMLKEIYEQPEALRRTLQGYMRDGRVDFSDLRIEDLFAGVKKIYIVGCGTAYHAGLIGRRAIEKLARIPVEIDIASEFCYRDIPWGPHELMIVISQSGETADTLAAMREAKRYGIKILAVTNVIDSTIACEADQVIYTQAGPEVSIASTKAYTCQLAIMYMLAFYIAQSRGTRDEQELQQMGQDLLNMDSHIETALRQAPLIKDIAGRYHQVENTFFLGRGFDAAVAMEGALKLKETSYIHAEAYPTGELKHGPIALITEGVPVLTAITQEALVERAIANIKEVKDRGGVIIAICTENLRKKCQDCDEIISIPNVNPLLAPITTVVPLQLFAYYMAVSRGNNVDKPRNLTKAVTVE